MDDRIAFTIRMDHPNKNALDEALVEWLERQLDEAGERPVLLTGTDSAFCAGLNLRHIAELDAKGIGAWLKRIDALATRIFLHPAPVVALVSGHAIAGGCVLACCCDHRVVIDQERVKIGVNEVALGACYPPAILNIVRARISPPYVERIILGAGLFSPREALAVGLVDEVAANAPEVAATRLEEFARHPAEAYARTKAELRTEVAHVSEDQMRRFEEEQLPIWSSPEMKARVLAVLR